MVQAADVSSPAALDKLNAMLELQSYIAGHTPSSADQETFQKMKVPGDNLPHLLRWYRHVESFSMQERKAWGAAGCSKAAEEEDIDLFGDSDEEEEDAEKKKIREQRLKAYAEKKSKKPAAVAKSNIILDVKPWDDETDLQQMEREIRQIQTDGLLWGASKTVPIAYGVKKLQISCVVEDDKVGTDFLEEQITALEDFVQSVDIVAFNKI